MRVQGLENVKIIAVGAFHNLALEEDGTLWAWGNNEYGQLGTGDTQPRSQPIPVQGLSGLTLVNFITLLRFRALYCVIFLLYSHMRSAKITIFQVDEFFIRIP